MNKLVVLLLVFFLFSRTKAQDTFSILAFDSITGEVGAAGASCVDLFVFSQYNNDFICELFPGEGAIATQASYLPANQGNAKNRFLAGDSPTQVISWLQNNDDLGDASVRQYGVVRINADYPRSAAHTGSNCMTYKNHVTGPNYSIQGNILLGQLVLDSMEARFNRETGDLACKLMAAMQGANMVGADTRCAPNNSSSLFAFLKVAQPTDTFGQSSLLLSLKTHSNDGIEPIDSLQQLFNAARSCSPVTVGLRTSSAMGNITLYPNPSQGKVWVKATGLGWVQYTVTDISGRVVRQANFLDALELDTEFLEKGIYWIDFRYTTGYQVKRLIIAPGLPR